MRKCYNFKDETVWYASNSCEAQGNGPPASVSFRESKTHEPEINGEREMVSEKQSNM